MARLLHYACDFRAAKPVSFDRMESTSMAAVVKCCPSSNLGVILFHVEMWPVLDCAEKEVSSAVEHCSSLAFSHSLLSSKRPGFQMHRP